MKSKLTVLALILIVTVFAAIPATAAPDAGPCVAGGGYDPACDANQDGQINITDIQLSAGHWDETGTWTGGAAGWALTGNAGTDPASNFVGTIDGQNLIVQPGAGRVGIGTTNPTNGKLEVAGGSGVSIYATSTDTVGMLGASISSNGVKGTSSDSAGVYGFSTNGSGVYGSSTNSNGVYGQTVTSFQPGVKGVNGAESGIGVRGEANATGGVGVWGQSNANTGVYGLSTDGIGAWGQSTNGVAIRAESANNYGVYVASAGISGVVVISANSNGLTIGSAGGNGVGVTSAGANGVVVSSAGNTGVNANTTQASGQWGFYTDDAIHGSNVLLQSLSLVAQVAGPDGLTPGDVVAAAGIADPVPGSTVNVPLVRLAHGDAAGVVGVVQSRLALTQQPQRPQVVEAETQAEAAPTELRSAEGPAQSGDYVAITVMGAAQVKVAPGETAIVAGTRLAAAANGTVRSLGTIKVQLAGGEGTADLAESAPIVGVALEPATKSRSEAERKAGMVWMLVDPQ